MNFETEQIENVLVITFEGELMGGNQEADFRKLIYDAIQDDQVNFIIDLQKTRWMNSSGLGMLISALTTARSSGGDLRLANVSERVLRPIQITKLDAVFQFYNSVADAIRSFKS